MDFQFYPTPPKLARRAWAMFKNREFVRVLEPSAGEGHLADVMGQGDGDRYSHRKVEIDCIEIDVTKHPLLREKGYEVVGIDFLQFDGAMDMYSHIILNPPFLNGAQHVLKAWNMMYDGEIVTILNAETIQNPCSKEREMLVSLIERNGEVEYHKGAFMVQEAERRTAVDVALVYLRKQAPFYKELMGDILDRLVTDEADKHLADGFKQPTNEVMIPASYIDNSVVNFNSAVEAMRQSVIAQARENLYKARCGMSMVHSPSPCTRAASCSWTKQAGWMLASR